MIMMSLMLIFLTGMLWNVVEQFWPQAGFLSVSFVSSLGMIAYVTGSLISNVNDNDELDVDIPDWYALECGGAILALLFWVCAIILCIAIYFSLSVFRLQS